MLRYFAQDENLSVPWRSVKHELQGQLNGIETASKLGEVSCPLTHSGSNKGIVVGELLEHMLQRSALFRVLSVYIKAVMCHCVHKWKYNCNLASNVPTNGIVCSRFVLEYIVRTITCYGRLWNFNKGKFQK